MLPTVLFQVTGFLLNLILVLFVMYYILVMRTKIKHLDEERTKTDTNYHQIVDNALTKERKILEDATSEAGHIIKDAQYVSTTGKQSVDQALQKMLVDVQGQTAHTSDDFKKTFENSLHEIANASLNDFQKISHGLQTDLEKQIKEFHETLLPRMEKELEGYKEVRIKQAEQTITKIVQQASQEILNKSISFEDHQKLMIDSLDKAKKEGMFG
jgi:hypothetical protein